MKRILCILAIVLSILACREEIDKGNRYTFTGETIADYMLNRNDRYSHMLSFMERAGLLGLLQTYGQYTLFLPDNDAVEKFVAEQDSIFWATRDTETPINTGVTSPLVEELSDSMANVIARMHLIENENYHTAEMGEGSLGKWNFNDRVLVISYKVVDERFYIMLNNSAAIIDADNQVENGIIHIVDKLIDPKFNTIVKQISEHTFFGIFNRAIAATGFIDAVSDYLDLSYTPPLNDSRYIKKKYIKFTAFIEPDEVFHANGIYNLDDLVAFAEKWYGTEEKGNYKNPKNALYKFVAYHFVEGEIPYNKIVPSESADKDFNSIYIPGYDLYSYFTTIHGTLLKALKPLSTVDGRNTYLNYTKREIPYNPEMRKHTNVRIIELTEFTQMNEQYAAFVPNAGNGIIHPIDKILIYDEDEMAGNILNERMRFNIIAMQPELFSNNIIYNDASPYITDDFCKGIKRCGIERNWGIGNGGYNGGVFLMFNQGNWAIKLPPVPDRTYEIRFSTHVRKETGSDIKDLTQVYLDGKVCGLPFTYRIAATDDRIGWIDDYDTYDNGVDNDRHLRNRGWMKAPDVYMAGNKPARMEPTHLRKIATTAHLLEGEHWLRFEFIGDIMINSEIYTVITGMYNYIELVPLHIVSDPNKPEDRH